MAVSTGTDVITGGWLGGMGLPVSIAIHQSLSVPRVCLRGLVISKVQTPFAARPSKRLASLHLFLGYSRRLRKPIIEIVAHEEI